MKKQFIAFCLILSFVFPLFISFFSPVLLNASPSGSSNNLDKLREAGRDAVGQKGYVIKDDFWGVKSSDNDPYFDWLCNLFGLSVPSGVNSGQVITNYMLDNDLTYEDIVNSSTEALSNYAQSQIGYYIYHAMPVSKFFRFFTFHHQDDDSIRFLQSWLPNSVNGFNTLCAFYSNYYLWAHSNYLYSISENEIANNSFVLVSGTFGDYPDYPFQSIITDHNSELGGYNAPSGYFKLYGNDTFLASQSLLPFVSQSYQDFNNPSYTNANDILDKFRVGFLQDQYYGSWRNFALGTIYLVPDSWGDNYTFMVFKNTNSFSAFFQGNAFAYYFDNGFSDYEGIDYSKLYDLINSNISHLDGNLSQALNDLVENYISGMAESLDDISNALINPNNNKSWLRLIYYFLKPSEDILDFPSLLASETDRLIQAIYNISSGSSGGSVDLSSIEGHLANIEAELQLQNVDQILSDFENDPNYQATKDDLVAVMKTKFPFSVVSDVEIICRVFYSVEMKPDWQFNIPYTNDTFTIDLSFYEDYLKDYVQAFLILLFIIFLLTVSIRIISFLA